MTAWSLRRSLSSVMASETTMTTQHTPSRWPLLRRRAWATLFWWQVRLLVAAMEETQCGCGCCLRENEAGAEVCGDWRRLCNGQERECAPSSTVHLLAVAENVREGRKEHTCDPPKKHSKGCTTTGYLVPKIFQDFPSHQILQHMHGALNINKKYN